MTASREQSLAEIAVTGALRLFTGKVASRAIGLIGGILVVRLLGFEQYGLLNIALVLPGILMLASSLGVNDAMTKYLAEYRSKGERVRARSMLYSGIILNAIASSSLSLICYFSSDFFASIVIGKPQVAPLFRAAALLIPGWTFHLFSQSVLIGLDETRKSTVLMVVQEAVGAILPVVLIVQGFGVFGALIGSGFAFLIPGVTGIFVAVQTLLATKQSSPAHTGLGVEAGKALLYGIPLGAATLLGTGIDRYFAFMIAIFATPSEIGSYNAALILLATITYLTFPTSAVTIPFYAKLSPQSLDRAYGYVVRFSSFVVLPAIALLAGLSRPLVQLMFGVGQDATWFYLLLLAVASFPYGMGGIHYLKLFAARGDTGLVVKLQLMSVLVGLAFGAALIPRLGVVGVIATGFISGWASLVISARAAYSRYNIRNPIRKVSRLYASALLALASTMLLWFLLLDAAIIVALGAVLGLSIYLLAVALTHAMTANDLDRIRAMLANQPLVGGVATKVLDIMKRLEQRRRP